MMDREFLQQSSLAVGDAVCALERLDMLRARQPVLRARDRHVNERCARALHDMREAQDILISQLDRAASKGKR